ncbi:MAG TPA: DHA2 family efflux MFS transporter permease subunit [Bacteroidales bacterium]|nr:DHA2 family efflux MFS transporter permease subunit [Bacteroidales bacterium]
MTKGRTLTHRLRAALRGSGSLMHPKHEYYKWLLLGNVMIGTFMAVLDATIVNVSLPKIMSSFGVGLDKIEWVLTAYMLSMAVALPTSGWLADKFGYKRLYFIGLFLFTLGSLLCGNSSDENMLIFSRIIQGLGAGTIQPLGMAIITREFPPHQRGIALGFWGISAAASVSFGPLIGGYLIDRFSWPLIFDVNIPVGIIAMIFTLLIQSEYRNPRVRRFDVAGFISITIFLPLALYTLSEGNAMSNSAGWNAPHILAFAAISMIALAAFITAELVVKEPLLDLRLLKNHNFGIANITMLIFSLGMFGSTFLLPIYLQNALGFSAFQAGSVFLPVGIIQGITAPISGRISDKLNPKLPLIVGVILFALSFYLNTFLSWLTELDFIMFTLYLRGFAMGLTFTSLSAISLIEIPRDKMAQASAITNSIRQLGGSLGVALLATMLSTRVNFHSQLYAGAVQSRSEIYQETIKKIRNHTIYNAGSSPSGSAGKSQLLLFNNLSKQAYIEGINDDFMIAGIITALGVIPILFLHTKKKELQKTHTTHDETLIE